MVSLFRVLSSDSMSPSMPGIRSDATLSCWLSRFWRVATMFGARAWMALRMVLPSSSLKAALAVVSLVACLIALSSELASEAIP